MSYHDRIHELIYSELQNKKANGLEKKKSISQDNQAGGTIFMPSIFELNCQSIIIHDYDTGMKATDYYGFSYSIISNQFHKDSFPDK